MNGYATKYYTQTKKNRIKIDGATNYLILFKPFHYRIGNKMRSNMRHEQKTTG